MTLHNSYNKTRLRIYELLEPAAPSDNWSRAVDVFLMLLIAGNALAFALDTIDTVHAEWGKIINLFTIFSVICFTIEYVLRIWSSVEVLHGKHVPFWWKRLKFALHPLQLIDLIVITTFWLAAILPYDLRVLRMVRLVVFFRIARSSPAMQTLLTVLQAEWKSLASVLTLMLSLVLVTSTGIYFLERDLQPEVFGNVPLAAWWAITTLTTVGYGDVVPASTLGKIFGGLVMIFGLGVFALPVGIIATGFAQNSKQKSFVAIWKMVTRVPILSRLNNVSLQSLVELFVPEKLEAGATLYQEGDELSRLIFVMDGELHVEGGNSNYVIGKGSFFGEMALVEKRIVKVTITGHTDCQLLFLSAIDFENFIRMHSDVKHAVELMQRNKNAKRVDVIDISAVDGVDKD